MGDPEKTIDAANVVEEELAKIAAEQQSRKQLVAKTATMDGAKATGVLRSSGRSEGLKPIVPILPFKRPVNEKPKADQKLKGSEKPETVSGPDLSLQGRAYDRERPMLEKTIAALLTMGIHFSCGIVWATML